MIIEFPKLRDSYYMSLEFPSSSDSYYMALEFSKLRDSYYMSLDSPKLRDSYYMSLEFPNSRDTYYVSLNFYNSVPHPHKFPFWLNKHKLSYLFNFCLKKKNMYGNFEQNWKKRVIIIEKLLKKNLFIFL